MLRYLNKATALQIPQMYGKVLYGESETPLIANPSKNSMDSLVENIPPFLISMRGCISP